VKLADALEPDAVIGPWIDLKAVAAALPLHIWLI
jgi:hypothetical protein